MTERALATIRTIDAIDPIIGADAIEVATVGGWKVVSKLNEFSVGDLAIYFEIDSWMPHELAPFLSKGQVPREYNGVKGERVRTVKLRGQVSQGLLLPVTYYDYLLATEYDDEGSYNARTTPFVEGEDVTEYMEIQKWERPLSPQLSGIAKGNFPSWIPKTDQPRCQNFTKDQFNNYKTLTWGITEKCEGSSATIYMKDGVFGVCSRNLDLLETEDNTFWKVARQEKLEQILKSYCGNVALQGEVIGPGIEGNIYKLHSYEFRLFDMWDIDKQEYFSNGERDTFARAYAINQAPGLGSNMTLLNTIAEMLSWADGKSMISNTMREGVVFKCETDPSISFKAISNQYLCNEK